VVYIYWGFLKPLNQYAHDVAEMGKWQKQTDCRALDLTLKEAVRTALGQ
jgi:hypothetical protein